MDARTEFVNAISYAHPEWEQQRTHDGALRETLTLIFSKCDGLKITLLFH